MTTALVGAVVCATAVAIALSPVTVVAAAALALIVRAVCCDVSRTERRVLIGILTVAIALRVAAIVALFLWSDPYHVSSFPFDGDGRYLKLRSLWVRNVWIGIPIDQNQFRDAFGAYGWTSYMYVLAYVQHLLGPAPYAVHLLSVCWSMAAAGLLYRLVRRSFGSVPALLALTFMLFLPTLFLWSISAMKESWSLLLMVVVLVGIERAVRGRHRHVRVCWVIAVVGAALALDTNRVGSLFIVVGSFLVALTGTVVTRRANVRLASLVALPLLITLVLQQPWVQARVIARVRAAAVMHLGHVGTEGYAYKLLDQRFYSGDSPETMTWGETGRFMLRAMSSFIFVPLPWQAVSRSQLLFMPQQLLWYGLVLLAALGTAKACRRDAFVAWLLIGLIGVSAVIIAPHEGNIGTLVRHRDGIVPFVGCLSAITLTALLPRVYPTARLIEDSVIMTALRRLTRTAVPGRASTIRVWWRDSALAASIDGLRHVEDGFWLRQLGLALLAGAALTVALGPFRGFAWPSMLACSAAAACALALIVYAPALMSAWRAKHGPMPIDTSSGMTT